MTALGLSRLSNQHGFRRGPLRLRFADATGVDVDSLGHTVESRNFNPVELMSLPEVADESHVNENTAHEFPTVSAEGRALSGRR
jgi:hypothetical protein